MNMNTSMRKFVASILCLLTIFPVLAIAPPPVQAQTRYAITFPCQVSQSSSGPIVAIQFDNPHLNGLPFWGPSGDGVTIIRRIKLTAGGQPGWYAQFWYTDDSSFEDTFTPNGYYGFHPYPQDMSGSDTDHYWEIAIDQGDYTTAGGGSPITVVKDAWYTQAMRVTRTGASNKTLVMYYNLPSVASADVITANITTTNYGENNPPQSQPQLTIGDSPWYLDYQHEKFCGQQGQIKIFDKVLSQADVVSEAGNMNSLVTAEGIANIWWGKKGFTSVDDLTDDYGSGRAWTWIDTSNKGTLGDVVSAGSGSPGGIMLGLVGYFERAWDWLMPHRPLVRMVYN